MYEKPIQQFYYSLQFVYIFIFNVVVNRPPFFFLLFISFRFFLKGKKTQLGNYSFKLIGKTKKGKRFCSSFLFFCSRLVLKKKRLLISFLLANISIIQSNEKKKHSIRQCIIIKQTKQNKQTRLLISHCSLSVKGIKNKEESCSLVTIFKISTHTKQAQLVTIMNYCVIRQQRQE